jgi:hypothetical protein
MPPALTDIDYDSPERWANLVKGSRQSGTSGHDLNFGHGNHIVTFVTWARGANEDD